MNPFCNNVVRPSFQAATPTNDSGFRSGGAFWNKPPGSSVL